MFNACFGSTYTKIGTIQRRLVWPLRKEDIQIREAVHIFKFLLIKFHGNGKKKRRLILYQKRFTITEKSRLQNV